MLQFRSLASQLCAVFPYNCLQFALGSVTGFHVILIAELYRKDSVIPTTLEQLSWFASLDIVKLFSSLITGFLAQRIGCRALAFTAALIYITAYLLYHYSTSATTVFASRTICSFLFVRSVTIPYTSEISEPRLRGRLLAMAQLSQVTGSFFSLLLGTLVHWRTIALVNLVFPILAAVTVLATPDSPAWLASKGRFEEAEKALRWLRGWVPADRVQKESRSLIQRVNKLNSTPTEQKLDTEANDRLERSRLFFQPFLQRSFYLPLAAMCAMFLVYAPGGSAVTDNYATVIFRKMNSPIEASLATAIMGAMTILGQLIVLLVIRRVGKRRLILFSAVVTGLCRASIAIVGFLNLQGEYLWIPPIAMIVATVVNNSGVEATVTMLNSEIFPSSARYVGASIGFSVFMITGAMTNKIFLYVVGAITLSGTFLVLAVINLLALVTFYFLFPETEGKSLKDIEDHYEGVRSLDERVKL